jgi:hypothetical protein
MGSSVMMRVEDPMKPQSHIVDLLSAAKLLADSQSNILLSYIINMAMIEASTGAANRKNEGEKGDASAA